MPLKIKNDFGELSLRDVVGKMEAGYSVVKSPHIGNQHPSNLVCASLGIPMRMVSFTKGERDRNFHPHLRIQGGWGVEIACPRTWTPFASTVYGDGVEAYHQNSVHERFPKLQVETDVETLLGNPELAEAVMRVSTTSITRLWYRAVDADGVVQNFKGDVVTSWEQVASRIFRFTNDKEGWIVPNRAHILFDFVWQSLESGRDEVYHLSGPQMVGYIGGAEKTLSKAYDALRQEWPGLPEVLTVCIVPVASARFVSLQENRESVEEIESVIKWYDSLPPEDRRFSRERFAEAVKAHPEFVTSIEEGTFLSQYDIESADDLRLSEWMLDTPLYRVRSFYERLKKVA